MKKTLLLIFIVLIWISVNAQGNKTMLPVDPRDYQKSLPEFSLTDSIYLNALPELPVPEIYSGPLAPPIPAMVDNSTRPYFRPAYNQAGYSCGQASLVGYNFTYEINRRRDVPGNISENQYPTHFTWNFDNAANYYGGVSYFHSIEILREAGNPNCAVYGGMAAGGEYRWMSGYDNYYHAMQNRITTAYQLKVNTPEGLQVLKHWIHDHLEGSESGGLASFYANQPWWPYMQELPDGTPEEGKYVTIAWIASSHSLCIVGYNDSIRWDYNEDGQYTNHLDINNDGVVDMKDWEIGGLKFVNSYGGVPNWGNEGFCYMMYKTLADKYGSGGIWNNVVTLLDVKEDCSPQLTLKVNLKHDKRDHIKLRAGLNTDLFANDPEVYLDFPIFNYQGSDRPMQGPLTEEAKYIEFGLDVSKLLGHLESGQEAKYFFQVIEKDPIGNGSGELISVSLMDYTQDEVVEIPCTSTNVPIINNDITQLSLTHTVDFDKVEILNNSLPPAFEGEYYTCQLMADFGSAPYFWDVDWTYDESSFTNDFPSVSENGLIPDNYDNSHVMQALEFAFPYYGEYYDTVWVHTDGTLQLQEDIFRWYYLIKDELLFPRNNNIAPFLSDLFLYNSTNDGMWYEGDANGATFRWKASISGQPDSELNFAVRLYPSGIIDMFYGFTDYSSDLEWWSGISRGTCVDYQFSAISGSDGIPENYVVRFTPIDYPLEMTLSDDGIFTGIPLQNYTGKEIPFKVTDNNFIANTRTLVFSSNGILIDSEILAGDDNIIEAGETAVVSVSIENYQTLDLVNATMFVSIDDTNFTLTDSVEYIGNLNIGDSIDLADAFSFDVSPYVPNGKPINIITRITDENMTHYGNIFETAYAPFIVLEEVIIDDGLNGMLDPGETTDIVVTLFNEGATTISDIELILSSEDQYITINSASSFIGEILPDSSANAGFNITASEYTPIGHTAEFLLDLVSGGDYENQYDFSITVGRYLENFESADFTMFPWGYDDNFGWKICNLEYFDGEYSARSALITHEEETSLIIDLHVYEEGSIRFYRKVSCEDDANNDNYDYLAFFIDGSEQQRWDGELDWEPVSINVSQGPHRLKWTYHKDVTVSRGRDAAWVDYITFPPAEVVYHSYSYSPDNFDHYLRPGETGSDTLKVANSSQGSAAYQILISGNDTIHGTSVINSIGGSQMLCTSRYLRPGDTLSLEFRAYNASYDNEWFKDIYLDFPEGMIIDSMTNFIGGSDGEMFHDTVSGNGASIHWHGENPDGWGVVKGGQTAIAKVYARIEDDFEDHAMLTFEIHGDIYGSEPHIIHGFIDIWNLGPAINWLSIEPDSGYIDTGSTEEILLSFNSGGLTDSIYHCYLHVFDNFGNQDIIPVILTVDTELLIQDQSRPGFSFMVYPNPFKHHLNIELNCQETKILTIKIFEVLGREVKSLINNKEFCRGKHTLRWDDISWAGYKGLYYIVVSDNKSSYTRKIMLY